jgi:hypothetical protein
MHQNTIVTIEESVSNSSTNLNKLDMGQDHESTGKERVVKRMIIVNKFIEWSALTTYHGYSKVFKTNLLSLKLFWSALLTFSLGMSTVLVARNITDYLKYETTSKIQIIHESPMDIPVITYFMLKHHLFYNRLLT